MNKLCVLFVFFALTANAQIESFDLSSYIQPEVKNKFVTISPSYNSDSYWQYNNGSHNLLHSFDFYLGSNFNNYQNLKNSNQSFSSQNYVGISSNISDFDSYKGISLRQQMNYLRNQYNNKNHFIGFGLASIVRFNRYRYSDLGIEDDMTTYATTTLVPQFSIGIGRVQNVEDAWLASSILKMLKKEDLLKRKFIPHDDITAFADVLSGLRNVRAYSSKFFDSRNLRNKQFQILCSYLIDNYMVDSTDPLFYVHLFDAWRFEGFRGRLSNNELRFGIEGETSLSSQKVYWRENIEQYSQLGPKLFIQYAINKPMGLKWQFTATNRIEAHKSYKRYHKVFEDQDYYEGELSSLRFMSDWRMDYLENARTNYYASFENLISSFESTIDVINPYKVSYIDSRLEVGIRHYFSPVLQLNGSIFLDYNSTDSTEFGSQLHAGTNMGFSYFLR